MTSSMIGRRIGRYEIRAELGRGGMARVYRAVDTQLQRTVALKVLAAQLSLDPEFVRRFEREATTAANLRHPAMVTIYDIGEQDGLHYIAMEYIAGRSLHTVLEERSTLGLGYAVSIITPVAQALDFAHAQGAVHRDVKPHNILLDQQGRILLTDFGIAQTTDADSERLTRTGVFMGTPEYISPEQAEARRVDGRSDLYSLAVVAYEIITGRVPFSGATPQLIVAHAQLPPPPPTSVIAHLPGELDVVLTRALAKRPEQRYSSGAAFAEALRAVADRYGTPPATTAQIADLVRDGAANKPAPPEVRPAAPPVQWPNNLPQLPATPPPPPPRRPSPDGVAPPRRPANDNDAAPPRRQTGSADGSRQQPANGRDDTGGTSRARPAPPLRSRPAPEDARAPRSPRSSYTNNPLPVIILGSLLVFITLSLIVLVARGLATPITFPTNAPTDVAPSPILAATFVSASETALPPTEAPSATPEVIVPSDTPTLAPTVAPTPVATVAPPTLPPTLPPPPPPSNTPADLNTLTPTDTPPAPSDTPESPTTTLEVPTGTPEAASNTPEPPTATSEAPSNTPEGATETPILSETVINVTPILP